MRFLKPPPPLRRDLDLDLLDRERDLRLDLDLRSGVRDLFLRSGERDFDLLLLGDLDLEGLARVLDLDLFLREGDALDFALLFLEDDRDLLRFTGDLELDRFLEADLELL